MNKLNITLFIFVALLSIRSQGSFAATVKSIVPADGSEVRNVGSIQVTMDGDFEFDDSQQKLSLISLIDENDNSKVYHPEDTDRASLSNSYHTVSLNFVGFNGSVAGKYRVNIPANVFLKYNGDYENDEFSSTFTINPDLPVTGTLSSYSIEPATDSDLPSISAVHVTFPNASYLSGSRNYDDITLTEKNGTVYYGCDSYITGKTAEILFSKEKGGSYSDGVTIREPGTYVLSIPSAFFKDEDGGDDDISPAITAIYTVTSQGEPEYSYTTDPISGGSGSGLYQDIVYFTLSPEDTEISLDKKNPDAACSVRFGNITLDSDKYRISNGYAKNEIEVEISEEILSTPGKNILTIHFDKGYFTCDEKYESPVMDFSYTLDVEKKYPVTVECLTKEPNGDIYWFGDFKLTFPEAVTVNDDGRPVEILLKQWETVYKANAVSRVPESKNSFIVSFTPVQPAGSFTFMVPKGFFSVDGGESQLIEREFNVSEATPVTLLENVTGASPSIAPDAIIPLGNSLARFEYILSSKCPDLSVVSDASSIKLEYNASDPTGDDITADWVETASATSLKISKDLAGVQTITVKFPENISAVTGYYRVLLPEGALKTSAIPIRSTSEAAFIYKVSAVTGIQNVGIDANKSYIYGIDGTLILRNASVSDLDRLNKGIYIFNGNIIVR